MDNKITRKYRRKQLDLFTTLSAVDVSTKSNRDLMSMSWFDLSKSKRTKEIYHETKDGSYVRISPGGEKGIANVWDMDVILFFTSYLIDRINKGEDVTPRLRFSSYEYQQFTGRKLSGATDKQLMGALERLNKTTIETNIKIGEVRQQYSFHWVSEWKKWSHEETGRVIGYEVVLPMFLFKSIVAPKEVLTLDDEFFDVSGGLERFIYLYCRKSTSYKATKPWKESFKSLYKKSAMTSPIKNFNFLLRKIISKQSIPNYWLEEENSYLVINRTRKSLHKTKEHMLDSKDYSVIGTTDTIE